MYDFLTTPLRMMATPHEETDDGDLCQQEDRLFAMHGISGKHAGRHCMDARCGLRPVRSNTWATTSHKGSEFSFVSTFKFRVDKEQIRALTQAQKHVVNCCGCVGHVATLTLR